MKLILAISLFLSIFALQGCKTTDYAKPLIPINAAQLQDIADTAVTAKTVNTDAQVDTGLTRIERATGKVGSPDMNKLDPANLPEVQVLLERIETQKIEHAKSQSEAVNKAKVENNKYLSRTFTKLSAGLCLAGLLAIGIGIYGGQLKISIAGAVGFVGGLLMGAAGLVIDHWLMPWVVWGSVIVCISVGIWLSIDLALELRKKRRLEILQDVQVPALESIKILHPEAYKTVRPILKQARRIDPKTEKEVAQRLVKKNIEGV